MMVATFARGCGRTGTNYPPIFLARIDNLRLGELDILFHPSAARCQLESFHLTVFDNYLSKHTITFSLALLIVEENSRNGQYLA